MKIFRNPGDNKDNLAHDLIGVGVLLVISIAGFIIGYNPIRIVFPKHVMISTQDWKGSISSSGVEISDSRYWEEERRLTIKLISKEKTNWNYSEIVQTGFWYANAANAELKWHQTGRNSDYWDLVYETSQSRDAPGSRLYCNKDPQDNFECIYQAHRGHWYTEVTFSSYTEEQLSHSDLEQVIARVNELLINAGGEEVANSIPIQAGTLPPPYYIAVTPTLAPHQTSSNLPTAPALIIPTVVRLESCALFQAGETRIVSAGTFIIGNIIIDDIKQFATSPNEGVLVLC